jgi:uncharacterized protein
VLRCQRCLEPMEFAVDTDETLVLAATLDEIHAEPADAHAPDRVVAGKEMALGELIEDELLLALPFAPRHEDCRPAGAGDSAESDSPFAALRGLIRNRH